MMCNNQLSTLQRLAASRVHVDENMKKDYVENLLKFPSFSTFSTGELLEHQTEHADKLMHIFARRNSAGDTSRTGTGKTYVAACVAKRLGLPVMVFCPKSVIEVWYKVLREWGVPIITITNYDMARSSHSDQDVKWYDMRSGITDTATVSPWIHKEKKVSKSTTKSGCDVKFVWNIPYKCFIIFDEEHVGKNVHTQTFALIKGAVQASKRSGHKMLFLSATPIEKKANLKSIMYFLGLTPNADMNSVNTFFRQHIGSTDMSDIHNFLYSVDMKDKSKDTGSMSSMPDAKIPDGIEHVVRPITYQMDDDTTRKIAEKNREILLLRERLRERQYDNTLGAINENRRFVESYKVDKIVDLAVNALTKNKEDGTKPYKRVCIFVNYKSTLHDINRRLSEKLGAPKVSTLYGDQDTSESNRARDNYNKGVTPVLIATVDKGGMSLSLHDTIGDLETYVIISPCTSASKTCQVLGRNFRSCTKSSVRQEVIFTQGDPIEESIRSGLQLKLDDIFQFTLGKNSDYNLTGDVDLYDLVNDEVKQSILHA